MVVETEIAESTSRPKYRLQQVMETLFHYLGRFLPGRKSVPDRLSAIELKVRDGTTWDTLTSQERQFLWDEFMALYPTPKQPWYLVHLQIMREMVAAHDNTDVRIIGDLGCGTGETLGFILNLFAPNGALSLYSRDISNVSLNEYAGAVNRAKASGEHLSNLTHHPLQCDLETATLEEILPQTGAGDLVNLGWIAPYLSAEGLARTLAAVAGFLRENGMVLISVHLQGYSIKKMLLRKYFQGIRDTVPLLLKGSMRLSEVRKGKRITALFEQLAPSLPTGQQWERMFERYGLRVAKTHSIFHYKGQPLGMIYLLKKHD